MAGKGWGTCLKTEEKTGSEREERGFTAEKLERWPDFNQADSLVSEMVLTAEPMLTSQVQDQDRSRWADPPGPDLSSQTGHQSCCVSPCTSNAVPRSLYYDYNPAIKSYSRSMRSQLANEWESTLGLCVDFKAQSWTLAKADTRLLLSSCPVTGRECGA